MAVSRLLRQRMLQGDQALERCNDHFSELEELGDNMEFNYEKLLSARGRLTVLREELLVVYSEKGLLDGKNAELRSAQLGRLLAQSSGFQEIASEASLAEINEHNFKRQWEVLVLRLQASRAELALRTAQIAALTKS